jgi:hypothetical protein
METIDILTFIGGLAVSVISYFLKQTMNDLKQVKEIAYETKSKLNVIENDYLNKIDQLNSKFDMLNESIKELTREIKNIK